MTMVNKLLSHPEYMGLPVESVAITLDATAEKCAHIQQIVRAGNIATVSFYNAAILTGDTIFPQADQVAAAQSWAAWL